MLFRSALLLALLCPLALSPPVHAQGQALQFDGVDDLAFVLDSSDDFDFGSALSLEAWIRVDTPQPNAGLIGTNADCGLVATMSSPGAATVITPIGAGSFSSAGSANSLPTGTWTHVCGTYDGSTIRTYVNGELRAIRLLTGSTPNTAALLIGVRNQTNYFAGVLDEVRFWNLVRTPLEIRQTWDRELAGNEAGLVGYYKFDAAGQDVIDSSPFGNDGLLGLTNQVEPEDPQRIASGISFRVDSVEEALLFDGVDDICTFLNAQGAFDL
ncbi:MAG: LamG domain-containing protein, partial [Planctomycetota bacterium]